MKEELLSNCSESSPELPALRSGFTYLADSALYLKEKPCYYAGPLDPQQEHLRTNLLYHRQEDIVIPDLRVQEHRLTLDNDDFEFRRNVRLAEIDLSQRKDQAVKQYIEESVHWLKDVLTAELVVCYDYRVYEGVFV